MTISACILIFKLVVTLPVLLGKFKVHDFWRFCMWKRCARAGSVHEVGAYPGAQTRGVSLGGTNSAIEWSGWRSCMRIRSIYRHLSTPSHRRNDLAVAITSPSPVRRPIAPCCDSGSSPSSTPSSYRSVCRRFRFWRPSLSSSLGGAVEAGGASSQCDCRGNGPT